MDPRTMLDQIYGPWKEEFAPLLGTNDEATLRLCFVAFIAGGMEATKTSHQPSMN
jgi:hypothetical protein